MAQQAEHAVLVGQLLGEVGTVDASGEIRFVAAIRQGYEVREFDADDAAVLEQHRLPQAMQGDRVEALIDQGALVRFSEGSSLTTRGLRALATGDAIGFDDQKLGFRLRGAGGQEMLVSEAVYWCWVYASTAASVEQLTEIAAALLPDVDASSIRADLEAALPRLLLTRCLTLDRQLESE